jgi:hypothetical protein
MNSYKYVVHTEYLCEPFFNANYNFLLCAQNAWFPKNVYRHYIRTFE